MGAKWPFQQFCWDTGQLALPSSHGVGTSSTHRHQLPPVPARHSQHQRAGPTHKFPVVPSPAQQGLGEEEEGGWPVPQDPVQLQKNPASRQQKGQEPSRGERGCYSPPPSLTTAREEQEKKHHAPVILGGVDVPRGEDVQGQNVGVDE